jgi:FMN reductase
VLIAATGGSSRHSLVLEHALRPLFAYLRAVVAPTAVYGATEDWGAAGSADGLASRIDRAGAELAALMAGRPAAEPLAAEPPALVPFEQRLAALRPGANPIRGNRNEEER